MNIRRIERGINFRAIISCVILNVLAAAGVLASTYVATGSPARAIFYTFISWSVTLSISSGYWMWYLFKRTKAGTKTKRNIAYLLVILSATALLLVCWVVSTINF
jgi:hypothetical protein